MFGHHKSASVRVATVGLNPSSTEFLNDKGDWKPATDRLPMVTDFGVRERDRLNSTDIELAGKLRVEYFQHRHHSFFGSLQRLMTAMDVGWNYVARTAVHVDLVACGTWRKWSCVSQNARAVMEKNCHKHLMQTLGELQGDTVLLFDGKTACEAIAEERSGSWENLGRFQDRDGDYVVVRFRSGVVTIADRSHKFAAWNYPANRLSGDALLRIASVACEAVRANSTGE